MDTYVIGDPHGGNKAFLQVLERSGFNNDEDTLICLGDVCDGFSQTPELIESLLGIKNLISIKGNHDDWCYQWMKYRVGNPNWLRQGGQATKDAYQIYHSDLIIKHEKEFFSNQRYYYIDDKNRLFVHGGFNHHNPFLETKKSSLIWDRSLYETALYWQFQHDVRDQELIKIKEFDEVFIGHTTTLYDMGRKYNNYIPSKTPVHVSNLWNLDTGGGFGGVLTILNVDTKEFWQSDLLSKLYPNEKGR
jgi:serine/threonine protein phosphatase 1